MSVWPHWLPLKKKDSLHSQDSDPPTLQTQASQTKSIADDGSAVQNGGLQSSQELQKHGVAAKAQAAFGSKMEGQSNTEPDAIRPLSTSSNYAASKLLADFPTALAESNIANPPPPSQDDTPAHSAVLTPANPTRAQSTRPSLKLEDWLAFVSKHERVAQRRVEADELRRAHMNDCKILRDRNNTFSELLERAQNEGFSNLQIELSAQSQFVSRGLEAVERSRAELGEVERGLIGEEWALRQEAPTILDRREDRTFTLLRDYDFDFRGENSVDGDTSSAVLSDTNVEMTPEVENYFSKLQEVETIEEQLLKIRHDRDRLQEQQDFEAEVSDADDETFEVLQKHEVEHDLMHQLHHAREMLDVARNSTLGPANTDEVAGPSAPVLSIDRYALDDALNSSIKPGQSRGELGDDLSVTVPALNPATLAGRPADTDALSEKAQYVNSWLSGLKLSDSEIARYAASLPQQMLYQSDSQNVASGLQAVGTKSRPQHVLNDAGSPSVVLNISRSEPYLNPEFRRRANSNGLPPSRPQSLETLEDHAQSLPGPLLESSRQLPTLDGILQGLEGVDPAREDTLDLY